MTAEYVGTVARSGYNAMAAADPEAVWCDSAWRFLANEKWWMGPKNDGARMKAFLHAVPKGKHISRDLTAEAAPVWQRTDSFYGTDWTWGMLQNFGGRPGMYGRLDVVLTQPAYAFAHAQPGTMRGIGYDGEAIEKDPVVYDALMDGAWVEDAAGAPQPLDAAGWLERYIDARYPACPVSGRSALSSAWSLLRSSVYNNTSPQSDLMLICQRPQQHFEGGVAGIVPGDGQTLNPLVGKAWKQLLVAAEECPALRNSSTYTFDVVTLTYTAMNGVVFWASQRADWGLSTRNQSAVQEAARVVLPAIGRLDSLLATKELYMLGAKLERARRWANTSAPYDASCDHATAGRRNCSTGPIERGGRSCAAPSTNCSAGTNCATCRNGTSSDLAVCLTCKPGYNFFDGGLADCTGLCGNADAIPVHECEYCGCCYNETSSPTCFEQQLGPEAQFVINQKDVVTLLGTEESGGQGYLLLSFRFCNLPVILVYL